MRFFTVKVERVDREGLRALLLNKKVSRNNIALVKMMLCNSMLVTMLCVWRLLRECRGEGGERAGVVWMSNKSRPYYEMQLDY